MAHPADPGGVFASDTHRRVLAALSHPEFTWGEDALLERVAVNENTLIDADEADELASVLADLEADGDAKKTKDGWRMTKAGRDKLSAPIAEEA